MAQRRTQAQRSAATRATLLAAARELFAKQGFAHTPREQIVERAGVTRGALYHHFDNKEHLFREVVERLQQEIGERIMKASLASDDAGERLRLGCHAFLDACLRPDVRRIVLLDAPAVLGAPAWREIDERHGLGLVRVGLEEAMASGAMTRRPVEPLAHLLLGALNEAAMLVATAARPKRARVEVGETVDFLLDSLMV